MYLRVKLKEVMKISRLLFLAIVVVVMEGCGSINASSSRQEINFEYVQKKAELLAQKICTPDIKIKNDLTVSEYNQITFNPSKALWANETLPFRLELFHIGYTYETPIKINEYKGQYCQDIRFTHDLFNFGTLSADSVEKAKDLEGYAGFKILCQLNKPSQFDELISFLGNERFRALGRYNVYGLFTMPFLVINANTQSSVANFREFWIGKPLSKASSLKIYAIADLPEAVAAFEYEVIPGDDTSIKVKSTIYPRVDELSVGIAPIASLYFCGRNTEAKRNCSYANFHYSDGLIMRHKNNVFYKPLENYIEPIITELTTLDIKYFGLVQRDRVYDHYQTPFIALHLMPNLWITPENNWHEGKVVLSETPTDDTNTVNINTFWVPAERLYRKKSYSYNYAMHWGSSEPLERENGSVSSTRISMAGDNICFAVRFNSDYLKKIPAVANITADITVSSNSKIISTQIQKDPFDYEWIVLITVSTPIQMNNIQVPISLSCRLMNENNPITETWTYKWMPSK